MQIETKIPTLARNIWTSGQSTGHSENITVSSGHNSLCVDHVIGRA